MKLTAEQEAILTAARDTTDNLMVVARAGSGKTFMLKQIANAMPGAKILCLAFNKAIATEMKEELPINCDCLTINAVSLKAMSRFLARWPKLELNKVYKIAKDMNVPFKSMKNVIPAIKKTKSLGYTPFKNGKSLMTLEEVRKVLEFELTDEEFDFVRRGAQKSHEMLLQSKPIMDFDDQVLVGATWPVSYERYDVVMVDEAQDLSPLNHALLKKIKGKRLIVVGDPLQAIYGFRGADTASMAHLAEQFNTVEYKLTTTFRCAKNIVKEAQGIAPDLQAWDASPLGMVQAIPEWNEQYIDSKEDCAVLCRLNAPLFTMNIIMFSEGINCEYVGNDIVQKLLKTFKSWPKFAGEKELAQRIAEWEDATMRRWKNKQAVRDEAQCMRIIIGVAKDNAGVQAYLRKMLNVEGRIKLMTVHKAKGLEYDNVFLLEPKMFKKFEGPQEDNILYVAQTRAIENLYYISFENYRKDD